MRRRLCTLLVLCLATGIPPRVSRADLIVNGSFEAIPGPAVGQGLWPSDFTQAGNISPGADTYSDDGSYGVAPGTFGNFIGATAQDGIRFVAGADFGNGSIEAFGQQLAVALTPGSAYGFTAYLRDSFRAGTTRGGYDLLLSPSAAFDDAGAVFLGRLDPTTGVDAWVYRSLSFVAPANAGSLPFFILAPYSTSNTEAYIGIDNVNLTAVPEPSSLLTVALGLVGLAGYARWARPAKRRLAMRRVVFAVALLILPALPAWGSLIAFDDAVVPGNFAQFAPDRYQSLGIIFDRDIPIQNVLNDAPTYYTNEFIPQGGTGPNALTLTTVYHPELDIQAWFVLPGTSIPALTDVVTVRAFDASANAGTTLGIFEAYDIDGLLLESLTAMTPAGGGSVEFTISRPGIARVRFAMDSDGGLFDNLSFNAPTAVPEPSSLVSAALGLFALAGFAAHRRHRPVS